MLIKLVSIASIAPNLVLAQKTHISLVLQDYSLSVTLFSWSLLAPKSILTAINETDVDSVGKGKGTTCVAINSNFLNP